LYANDSDNWKYLHKALDKIKAPLKKYEDIDVNAAVTLMDEKDLIILDVREKKERSAGHIANDIQTTSVIVVKICPSSNKNSKTSMFILLLKSYLASHDLVQSK
jgi:rhodanese-related sulfurtransferase